VAFARVDENAVDANDFGHWTVCTGVKNSSGYVGDQTFSGNNVPIDSVDKSNYGFFGLTSVQAYKAGFAIGMQQGNKVLIAVFRKRNP
jgi:hypothetical protein